ncbi:MAG: glycosyltransferase, partial [Desulfobacteraceae bacterium]|nr:glycosyltransferase [Desulfobacteraceae bacterium]
LKYLIDAFSRVVTNYPKARLLVLGRGTNEDKLKQQCAILGVAGKVHFVGYQDNVDAWLNLFDVFALPSLAEYHSIGLLEAMRAGKAIVATTVGGNPESVRHDQQALLVPPANPVALASALTRLTDNSNLCRELGASAQKRFTNEFSETRMLEKTAEWLLSFKQKNCS